MMPSSGWRSAGDNGPLGIYFGLLGGQEAPEMVHKDDTKLFMVHLPPQAFLDRISSEIAQRGSELQRRSRLSRS